MSLSIARRAWRKRERERETERRDVRFDFGRTAEPILWYRGAVAFEVLAALDAWQTHMFRVDNDVMTAMKA